MLRCANVWIRLFKSFRLHNPSHPGHNMATIGLCLLAYMLSALLVSMIVGAAVKL